MSNFVATVFMVLAWYGSNIGVLLLNKFLLTSTGFKSPVFLTLCHMVACATLATALSGAGLTPLKKIQSRAQLTKVMTLSCIFCATIVMGNASLRYIPISFNQAIGATTPFFTAIFAFLLQGTREVALAYAALIPVAVGVVVASGGEPQFHMLGFVCCVLATSGRALKSVVQAMIMNDPAEKLDPMSLLMYMSGFSIAILLPATMILEPQSFDAAYAMCAKDISFFWWLVANSSLAYLVNLTNFLVTKYTSALTLQVLGNAKGVIAAVVSVMVFHNPVTWRGVMGYAITFLGVFLYSEAKRRSKQVKQVPAPLEIVSASDGMKDEKMPLLKAASMSQDARVRVVAL